MCKTVKQLKIQPKRGKKDSHIQVILNNVKTKEMAQWIK